MSFTRPQKLPIAFQILFLMLSIYLCMTLFLHVFPLFKTIHKEEDVFFGQPSFVTDKSFTGSKIFPLLDSFHRIRFQLNNDTLVSFYLYSPKSTLLDLSYWFPLMLNKDGSMTPGFFEVRGYRISETEWVVSSLESSYGALLFEDLFLYRIKSIFTAFFFGSGFLGVAIFFFVSLTKKCFSLLFSENIERKHPLSHD